MARLEKDAMINRVGQQLGSYHVLRLLGRGGFADVYLGEHTYLKSFAALKVLHAHLIDEDAHLFLREAQTLARLSHAHIVRILDFAVQEGVPFLAMEYAPGGTLRTLHPKDTRLPLETVVSYVIQVAEALQYAHEQGVIHRDVKPENMLLGSHAEALLSDFGMAMLAPRTSSYNTQTLEQPAVGTIPYVAPEQMQSKPQPASDQYALGIVVYEWLTGTPPFRGSPIEIAMQHLSVSPPPLRDLLPGIPPAVEAVVLRALAKGPEQRYPSVLDFATAFQRASQDTEVYQISISASDSNSSPPDSTTAPPPVQRDLLALMLSTNIHMPRPRSQLVSRTHLTARLQQGMEGGLILISAPAGFGKTTLLSQWLAERATPVAWLSLDAEDNDPTRFLSHLIAALQTVDERIGTTALALLHTPQPAAPEAILALLMNDLISCAVGDCILVLDDYHVISVEPIHSGMRYLVEHLPSQLHLVLATRADPPLPLARLRARGQLTEVRAADLRFAPDEVSAFLKTVVRQELPPEAIATLEQRTEGWIAGLQLAALSLQGRADISAFLSAFTGSHRFVLDYLSEEVLSQQPASVQNFLLHTCLLDRLSGSLCDAVAGREDSQTMLEALDRANLFVISLDDERCCYRYHHLFAEVLYNRLLRVAPALVPELHRRAGTWYLQHELVREAVHHLLAAGDVEHVADVIEGSNMLAGAANGEHIQQLLGWLNHLPDALLRARPTLCIFHAIALMSTNQLPEAEARLQDAERRLHTDMPADQARLIQGQVATVRANLASFSGDLVRTVMLSQLALKLLPQTETIFRAVARINAGPAYLFTGDVTINAERFKAEVVLPARITGNLSLILSCFAMLAHLLVMQGRLREAVATYEEAAGSVPGQEALHVLVNSPTYFFGLGDVHREWNNLETAEHYMLQGIALVGGMFTVDKETVTFGYIALARLQVARGEYQHAIETLDALAHLAQEHSFAPHLLAHRDSVRAQVELAQGHLDAAIRWAGDSGLSASDEDLSYLYEREYLTLARVRIAQGLAEPTGPFLYESLSLLARLLLDAEAKGRMHSALEILVLQALALDARGDRKRALLPLERALRLAEPEGYQRLFLDEGEPMTALLRQAHARSLVPSYVATLLSAFGEQVPAALPSHAEALVEPLTEREREVLRLLIEGASNREIAQRLVVSVNTAKKHVFNICSKLGVQSRAQALAKARTLHLF